MSKKKEKADSYMRYSGMAFELVGILVVGVFVGKKLDAWMGNETAYATLGLLVFFLIAYFFRIYYTLVK